MVLVPALPTVVCGFGSRADAPPTVILGLDPSIHAIPPLRLAGVDMSRPSFVLGDFMGPRVKPEGDGAGK